MGTATVETDGQPVVVTIPAAARTLAVSKKTIRRLLADGRLPAVRVGRLVRVPVAAIEKLVSGAGAEPSAN